MNVGNSVKEDGSALPLQPTPKSGADSNSSHNGISNMTSERAQARWSILRSALLGRRGSNSDTTKNNFSIHRFPGYQLLKPNENFEQVHARLMELTNQHKGQNPPMIDKEETLHLMCTSMALAVSLSPLSNDNKTEEMSLNVLIPTDDDKNSDQSKLSGILSRIQAICAKDYSVDVVLAPLRDQESPTVSKNIACLSGNAQDGNIMQLAFSKIDNENCSKYTVCQYEMDAHCRLWTREPNAKALNGSGSNVPNTRISLKDLVSHRNDNTGIDNTGNICVWDSERTMAYLLYHHLQDFHLKLFENAQDKVADPPKLHPHRSSAKSIMELGSGMAGLSAVALGLRMVQDHQKLMLEQENVEEGQRKQTPLLPPLDRKHNRIRVTLTDGHPEAVLNNKLNQHLTALDAHLSSNKETKTHKKMHPYQLLDVSCLQLRWTTDTTTQDAPIKKFPKQDIILISDCTHFQDFHAALACTTLSLLHVGGTAMFCQPHRGDTLSNFVKVLTCTSLEAITEDEGFQAKGEPLLSFNWWDHEILRNKHLESLERFASCGMYDPNLHQPQILFVHKLREFSDKDRQSFIDQQASHDTNKSKNR